MTENQKTGARLGAALVSGGLLGAGLVLSGMSDPGKVLGFLDWSGAWNPALMGVLGGAVLVSLLGFQYAARKVDHPWLDTQFHVVSGKPVDRSLVIGAVLFGLGWGLAGYCPGPAWVGLALGNAEALWFMWAMIFGGWLQRKLSHWQG